MIVTHGAMTEVPFSALVQKYATAIAGGRRPTHFRWT
jgi:hypothetical protein